MNDNHILPDILKHGLDIVFCGTAASLKSAKTGHYYAHPRNRFWETLHDIGLTPVEIASKDDRQLLEYGIGLTDLVKDESGMESQIAGLSQEHALRKRFEDILHTYSPKYLAFNGKGDGAVQSVLGVKMLDWGNQSVLPAFPDTQIWVLPNTSSTNGHFNKNRCFWDALAKAVKK